MNSDQDKQLREEEKKYLKKRESVWLDRIRPYQQRKIFFICGEKHVESEMFPSLLEQNRLQYTIICQQISLLFNATNPNSKLKQH